jgi:hypothetical protein
MKKKWLGQHENLQREIFIRAFYRDYSFGLIEQITAQNPITKKVLEGLLVQGQQRYAELALKNHKLEPFHNYSLSELESIKVN